MKDAHALGRFRLLLLTLVVVASPAYARLGETFEECKARYGEPVKVFQDGKRFSPVFDKGSFLIQIEFFDGKAGVILFRKPIGLGSLHSEPLTDTEIATLMRAEGSKSPWQQADNMGFGVRGWKTQDERLYAIVDEFGLTLATKEGMTRYLANGAAKERENLKGF